MCDRYVYDKEDVKKIILKIKRIFDMNNTATIIVYDFVKAAYYGLAEGIEEDSYFGFLIYTFSDEEISASMTIDVFGDDQYFIKDFTFKDNDSELDIYDIKYDKKLIYYIWFLMKEPKKFGSYFYWHIRKVYYIIQNR